MTGSPRIEGFLRERIAAGHFPGASYLVAEGATILAEGACGRAAIVPRAIAATARTLYDLGSLTKPLATALLAVVLERDGRLLREDLLGRHLAGWRPEGAGAGITLNDLLAHRSGLPAWAPLYAHAADRAGRIAWMARAPLAAGIGERVIYSDLGYILLGFALEAAGGARLDRLFRERVLRPAGLRDLRFRPPRGQRRRVAPTEAGNRRERELARAGAPRYNGWRHRVIWGEVHDHNAHTLGGVAGHAGLFGTARGVHGLAVEFLGEGCGLLRRAEEALFRTNLTAGLGQDRAVGFQLASSPGSSAGRALSGTAFGHTGFTGTSLWIDPVTRRILVLLTNRVHPRDRGLDMNAVRRRFHAIARDL